MKRKPTTIDEYLASVTGERRRALESLRRTIRKIVPHAEECISYRIPAFKLEGEVIAGFCATARGCSYFPFSGSTLGTMGAALRAYGGTKSSLHFDPGEPLPPRLVRELIETRIAEVKTGSKRRRRPASAKST